MIFQNWQTDNGQKIKLRSEKSNDSRKIFKFLLWTRIWKKTVTINQTKESRRSKDNQTIKNSESQPVFKRKLPISVAKYNVILQHCNNCVIPNRYHQEYISLKRNWIVENTLQEADEEDCNIGDWTSWKLKVTTPLMS